MAGNSAARVLDLIGLDNEQKYNKLDNANVKENEIGAYH